MLSQLISWAIEKVSPLDYILGALLIATLGWSASLKVETLSLKSSLSTCKEDNGYLLSDKVRYESSIAIWQEQQKEKIIYVDREVEKIKWKTETKIKTIKEYVKDENLTDCQNAMAFARSFF